MPSGRTQVIHHFGEASAVGALGASSTYLNATKLDGTQEQGCQIEYAQGAFWSNGKTTNDGPLVAGYSVGLTAAEVSESFLAQPKLYNDPGASEESNRRVYPMWYIDRVQTSYPVIYEQTKIRRLPMPKWEIAEHEVLSNFIFNAETGAAINTGMLVYIILDLVVKWLKD